MELNVLDLFSGIGGFSVGLEATGKFKTIGFCEQDKFCQKVLRKHWNDVPIYEDIKKLDAKKITADIITSGFPCQPISIAGKQKGKDDDRYLFPEMLRVVKEVKPRWFIAENVSNLINISDGQILQELHNSLEACGFEVQTFNISASSQGAWHKRARVWIVAANSNSRLRRGRGAEFKSRENEVREFHFKEEEQSEQHIRSKVVGHNVIFGERKNLSDTKRKGLERLSKYSSTISKQDQRLQFRNESSRGEKRQKTWWQTQSELCGVPNGVQYELYPDRANRIKALGNSIVPQIVTEIGKAIIAAEKEINGI